MNTELLEKIRKQDVITILELLEISADELVDSFLDKIDDRQAYIAKELEE